MTGEIDRLIGCWEKWANQIAMLIAMLVVWIYNSHEPVYGSMEQGQSIA